MSYNSSRKKALDQSKPIHYRVSDARSCAVCVCEKFRVKRSVVIEEVLRISGVDLNSTENPDDLIKAMDVLEIIRFDDSALK